MGEKEQRLYEQQGLCWLCDRPMRVTDATWDHIIPRSHGGSWDPSNLKLAHESCNRIRGSVPPEKAREHVQLRLKYADTDIEAENRVRRLLGYPPLKA
jgi:5-methylcytosine-specific restriction endonuclease McrA